MGSNHRTHATTAVVIAAAGFAGSVSLAAPPVRYSTIALTGDAAPGLPGVTFIQVSDPRLDAAAGPDSGTIGFWTKLAGTGITTANNTAFWLRTAGNTSLLARQGDPAPDTVGTYSGLTALIVRPDGLAMFTGVINENLGNRPVNVGLFAQDSLGVLQLIDREALDVVEIYGIPQWNGAGTIAYGLPAALTRSGRVDLVGEIAPGMPGGFTFRNFAQQPTLGPTGEVVFHASAGDVADSSLWRTAIYSDRGNVGGELEAVVVDQSPAPGVPGATFRRFGREPVIDANGDIWFQASLNDAPNRNQGIWRAGPLVMTPIVLAGDIAPGTIDTINRVGTVIGVSANGDAVFNVGLLASQGINECLLRYSAAEGLSILARDGAQAPHLPGGVVFRTVGPASISESGQVAFFGSLIGEGVTIANNQALWATDPSGKPRLVVRTGTAFEIPGVGPRVVRNIAFGSGPNASGSVQFAGSATLAFKLTFEDFSEGLFLADVPCPSDFDASGFVDIEDYTAFVQAFEAGTADADFDGSGFVDIEDFTAFVLAFEGGC